MPNMHPDTVNACELIDASFFSSDTFHDRASLEFVEAYLGRWTREAKRIRESLRPASVMRTRFECGKRVATICQHCTDKAQGDAWAIANDFEPSHSICSTCLPIHHNDVPAAKLAEWVKKTKEIEGVFID
jgi:hypothetical protein